MTAVSVPPNVGAGYVIRMHLLFLRRRFAGWIFRLSHAFRGVYIESGFMIEGARHVVLEPGVVVQRRSVFTSTPRGRLTIGAGSRIGSDAVIAVAREVTLGRNVLIAARCYISDHGHRFSDPERAVMHQGAAVPRPVYIGDGSWLGINVCILPGVRLGRNCVVGANSVVTQSVPDGAVVAGVPARVLRDTAAPAAVNGEALP